MSKRILFLSAWYPSHYDPMPGLFVKRHAEIIASRHKVAVLYTLPVTMLDQKYKIEISEEDQLFTVRVFYRKVNNWFPGLNMFYKFFLFFVAHQKGFKKIKKHFGKPDLIHVNILTRTGIYALCLKFYYKIPYVITEHWSRYLPQRNEYKGFFRKAVTKLVVGQSNAISTVSEALRKAMRDCHINHPNFLIVRNVVDCDKFKPVSIAGSSQKVFSHVSCFDDNAKNIMGMIRAIHNLSKKRDDFICLMVGDGPDRPEAEKLAELLGILNRTVKFVGLREGEELVSIYNKSLFTLIFSNYETMSVVIPESFACGKPVIATNVGGIPEIVNSSTGILVTPKNETELTEKIDYMLHHYHEFDPVIIRDYALKKFSKESVLNQLLSLYEVV